MNFHRSQVLFYLLSAFLVGVFLASVFNISQFFLLVILIAGIGLMAVGGLKNRLALLIGFILVAFSVGAARFNSSNLEEINLSNSVGGEVTLSGYVDSEPEIDGNRARFVFKTQGERVLVTTSAFPEYKFGDTLSVRGELELPQNFTDFDYVTYLKKDGVRTVIFYPEKIEKADVDLSRDVRIKIAIYRNLFAVKDKFQNAINLSIPEPNAAFINGILLGTRQNIPDDLKDAFSKTGTTHILAISGYNIMIISEAILLGLIWFFRRRTAFWISVVAIILFVILTGASASVVRAAIMGLVLSFAHGYGRLYDQRNSIILAGAIMVWFNPMVLVFDIGFQLSFAAVLGLIYLYPYVDSKLYKLPKLGNFKELTLMTLSAQVTVAPLLIYYFGNFSLVSLPTNILILPFVPVAMFFGFLTGISGMMSGFLGQIIGYIAWAITSYQIWIVNFFA